MNASAVIVKVLSLFLALVLGPGEGAVKVQTVPEVTYDGKAIVLLSSKDPVTLQCTIVPVSGELSTNWFIRRRGSGSTEQVKIGGFVINGNLSQTLTIVNITQDLDRAEISCGTDMDNRPGVFLLGFPVLPQLKSIGTLIVIKGKSLAVSVEANGNNPFPPEVTFEWKYNGIPFPSEQRISVGAYNITIADVHKQDSGTYGVVVSNNIGRSSTNFTLTVAEFSAEIIAVIAIVGVVMVILSSFAVLTAINHCQQRRQHENRDNYYQLI